MNIGILTQPLGRNYGGILQNYALQQVIKSLGHNPITIDSGQTLFAFILSYSKSILMRYLRRKSTFPERVYEDRFITSNFIRKYIRKTEPFTFATPVLLYKYNLHCVISGSDQVWRPEYNTGRGLARMYQNFVWGKKCKRIAYAASFGVDTWEYTIEQTKKCSKLAKRFVAISVREKSGIKLCKEHLGVDAIEVLDPTLMLSAEHYTSLCKNVPQRTEKFIAAYVLDLDSEKKEKITLFAKKCGLSLRLFSADKNANLTVEEWLSIFRDAEYVITDSFHGTVFSILNHKPFTSITNEDRGASRFHSLLGKFDLENRLISDFSNIKQMPDIDWYAVDTKITEWQKISKEFLEKALCPK